MYQAQIIFLLMLVLNTFAAYSFCDLLYLQFRQYRLGKPAWGGWTWRTLTLIFTIFYFFRLSAYVVLFFSNDPLFTAPFANSLVSTLTFDGLQKLLHPLPAPLATRLPWTFARGFIAPLIMQLMYHTESSRLPRPWLWRAITLVTFAVVTPVAVLWTWRVYLGTIDLATKRSMPLIVQDVTLAAAGAFTAIVIFLSRRPEESKFRRSQRRWYGVLVCILAIDLLSEALGRTALVDFVSSVLPLSFVVVTVYYGERLAFFDVFAKRGLLFFLGLLILACYFALVSPYLAVRRLLFVRSWTNALILVPVVLATPWVYRKLSSLIDRVWLGRRFSSITAITSFSEAVQGASDEQDLLERAESSLSNIFQSKACIDPGTPLAEPDELRTAIKIGDREWGTIRILPRADEVPFLSEDAELLNLLAHSFGGMLENQRLRDEGALHEQREEELSLSATQSQLKALRAQINPHFLFNALNTIASMIPGQPNQAEQTVEQLAEVFRYTVRGADREWVRLDEEMDFVRAYLEIEQARFGPRLRVQLDTDETARNIRLPAMVIQTLVENAVKHGISAVRGPCFVNVSAKADNSQVMISVEDNGPGFETLPRFDSLPESSNGGYGLKNVQDRLSAYYGAGARLRFARSDTTLVSFVIPAVTHYEENV